MNNFICIANSFNNKTESSVLNIRQNHDQFSFDVFENTKDTPYNIDPIITKVSLQCLQELIGEIRFKRICTQSEVSIPLSAVEDMSLVLTKNIVRKVFVGFLHVQKADYEEKDANIVHLFPKNLEELKKLYLGHSPQLKDLFIDKAKTSGHGFQGLIERTYIIMQHHLKIISEINKTAAQIRDLEMLTSRLGDRELRESTLIHLSDGFFYVDKVFIGGGAYISVLKSVQNDNALKIICRGTAIRYTATGGLLSGLNDILLEIGSLGIKSTWPSLKNYLQDNKPNSVDIYGKSLGGAHAQELAILVEGVLGIPVGQLSTYCSVGVGNSIDELFAREVLEKRQVPHSILVVRNGDENPNEADHIPIAGGDHIGSVAATEKCITKVCYIQPNNLGQSVEGNVGELYSNMPLNIVLSNFVRSFGVAHCRQTTLEEFSWKFIEGDQKIEHLRSGRRLETYRKGVAYAANLLSLFWLNGQSFNSYFLEERRKHLMAING